MKQIAKNGWLLLLLLFMYQLSSGQDNYATNLRTTISEEKKLFINFDIVSNDGSKYFHVVLEFNHLGSPVKPNPNNLFGDHGHAITSGNKIIYWNYENDFRQDITQLEVKVFAYREREPQAKFRSAPEQGHFFAPCKMNFTNLSENCDRYAWDFGDAASGIENNSFEANPSHIFKKGGRYTIALTAINTALNLQDQFYETIVVKEHEKTTADFKIIGFENLKNQSAPITIEFKNLSVNADSYQWEFGDPSSGRSNNTSANPDPSHHYKNPGQYTIELTAKNSLSGLSSAKSMEIVLPGKPPKEAEAAKIPRPKAPKNPETMKYFWMGSTFASAITGTALYFVANSTYNDYRVANTTASALNLRNSYEKQDAIYPILFGVTAVSAIMTGIQIKKQKNAQTVEWQAYPLPEGGGLTLCVSF